MKKIFPIFMFALLSIFVVSCDNNDDVIVQEPVATDIAKMRDVTGTLTAGNNYSINTGINILSTDVVLVYRNFNSNSSGSPVWQLLPKTYYLSSGRELDFNFLFDPTNVEIFSEANFDQALMTAAEAAEFKTNQTFRIVLIPADPAKNANKPDFNDYNAVVKYYGLQEPK